jgi:prolyl 4-hydroxylase
MFAGHLDLTQPLCWTVPGVLSSEECEQYIERMRQASDVEIATITGRDGEVVDPQVRSNTRLMYDDPAWAAALFTRLEASIPQVLMKRRVAHLNPRIRLYRYGPGQRHGAHWDTPVALSDQRETLLTLVLYLNDNFTGGETLFDELKKTIKSAPGLALLFQHRVLHTAEPVTAGEKFVMRSDVFYYPEER